MKRIVLILAIACLTANGMAQDTIRFTWEGSTNEKTIHVGATSGSNNIIINWGDGTPSSTYNGTGFGIPIPHTYADTIRYNVLITTTDANTVLTYLYCSSNQLTALDVSGATELWRLSCFSNQLTALDVSQNTTLTELYCSSNQFSALDVSQNTALTELYCESNQLSALDLSKNTALTKLSCEFNQLKTLDLSQNAALTELRCRSNQLSALDLSQNTALTGLFCSSNRLTALDVSQNTALTELYCEFNQLSTLDLSQNTALTYLHCESNQLTVLDLNDCTELTTLYCESNQLTALDISQNTALTMLNCQNNQLSVLDISQNTGLTTLNCQNNQLPLSQLYPIWKNKGITSAKTLMPQSIYDTVVVNRIIDLSNELAFGTPAVQTRFDITKKDGSPATDNYTFEDGELLFTALGDYKVAMQNDSVRSGISEAGTALTVTAYYHVQTEETSIEEIETGNISIYPNPTTGQLTIESPSLRGGTTKQSSEIIEKIEVCDISGRTVETWHAASLQTIDISHLSNGIYLLKVKTTEGETVRKIVKQ